MIPKLFASAAAAMLLALGLCSVSLAQPNGCGGCTTGCAKPCDDCGGCKTCVPKTETKKVAKPYYDCKCVQFCLPPKCQIGGHGHNRGCGGCGDCGGCNDCGQCAECCAPRTKKVLIKKIKIEEQCETTCELQDAPCAPACESCEPCRKPRLCNLHRSNCCEAAPCCNGPVIILNGAAPPAQGAEPIAPPKNMP